MAPSTGHKPSDENTPLLAADPLPIYEEALVAEESIGDGNGIGVLKSNGEGDGGEEEDKPLPKLQIFLLCFARLIEPIAFFGIFPFLPKMIEETGNLDEEDIGFYSGFIVCSSPDFGLETWEIATFVPKYFSSFLIRKDR